METCRTCAAPIRWTQSEWGSPMPLDTEPADDGNIIVVQQGGGPLAIVLDEDSAFGAEEAGEPLYRSHFSTCPDAWDWRKR